MGYIGDIAKAISKTIAGDNASITEAFSREVMENLGRSAVNADINSASKKIITNAMNNKVITKEAFEEAAKADNFNFVDYADKVASDAITNNSGDKVFQESITEFKNKLNNFTEVKSGAMSEAEYFGRKSDEGIGLLNTAKGYFKDPVYGSTRTKATIGAIGAGAIGIRYLSGGTFTTNNRGERDIVGIPLI